MWWACCVLDGRRIEKIADISSKITNLHSKITEISSSAMKKSVTSKAACRTDIRDRDVLWEESSILMKNICRLLDKNMLPRRFVQHDRRHFRRFENAK